MKRRILFLLILLVLVIGAYWLFTHATSTEDNAAPASAHGLGLLLEESADGLHVLGIRDHSRASHAGLLPGDVLLCADDLPLHTISTLDDLLAVLVPPCRLTFTVQRSEQQFPLTLSFTH